MFVVLCQIFSRLQNPADGKSIHHDAISVFKGSIKPVAAAQPS